MLTRASPLCFGKMPSLRGHTYIWYPREAVTPKRPTALKRAPHRGRSAAELQDQLDHSTRELSEAVEQQAATSEVLRVISSSPGDLKPVFDFILKNATRLCEAYFGALYLCEGDAYRTVAMHNAPLAFVEARTLWSSKPPRQMC